MKKTLVILLSFLYLVLSTGFTQYTHLCKSTGAERYSLTSTKHNTDKPCPICAAKEKGLKNEKKDCCKHKVQIVKIEDAVKKQSGFDYSVKFWCDAIPNKMLGTVFDFSIEDFTTENTKPLSFNVPFRGNPLYILHCVYRI